MALLNPPQILPNIAEGIHRYLLQAENHTERRETLIAILAPASLEQNSGKPGSKALDDTLRACEQIRLVEVDGESVRLHPDLPAYAIDRHHGSRPKPRRLGISRGCAGSNPFTCVVSPSGSVLTSCYLGAAASAAERAGGAAGTVGRTCIDCK